jgi:hypothetical protein
MILCDCESADFPDMATLLLRNDMRTCLRISRPSGRVPPCAPKKQALAGLFCYALNNAVDFVSRG